MEGDDRSLQGGNVGDGRHIRLWRAKENGYFLRLKGTYISTSCDENLLISYHILPLLCNFQLLSISNY